jgi:flagellar basal-body rod modification protein FlgD
MSAITGLSNPTTEALNGNRFADLSSEDFVKIMVEELTSQDPFQPNDSTAVLEQIASIRNIESQGALEKSLQSMVLQNSVAQSGSLIGHWVKGLDANNQEVQGLVTSVRIEDGKPMLKLSDGQSLAFDRVTGMDDAADVDAAIIQQLLANLQVLDSAGLIGKHVTGKDQHGKDVAGLVMRVDVTDNGEVFLELDTGKNIPASGVRSFGDLAPAAGGA